MKRLKNEPWQLLVIAGTLLILSIVLMLHQGGAVALHGIRAKGSFDPTADLLSEGAVHGYGSALLLVALCIVGFTFHLRREIALDERFPHRRRRPRARLLVSPKHS